MSKYHWFKFYPADLRNEPTLKLCSWEARWLWIEMLCLMHEADPYGHLVVGGKPVTDAQLAALTGADPSTVSRLKTELEEAGVFSKNREGVIYSRRMTRDYKKSKTGEKFAKKRWKSEKSDDPQHIENNAENSEPNREPTGPPNGNPNAKKLEAKKLEKEKINKKEKSYWWKGKVIKLNREDYERWFNLYPGTDEQFMKYLDGRDEWFAGQAPEIRKRWFVSTGNDLANMADIKC